MNGPYFALFCEVDHDKETLRHAKRGEHLTFLNARKERIHFGGPLTSADGVPETMLILLRAEGIADAHAFMSEEPYNRSGVFKSIAVRPWTQVLPESRAGEMDEAIAAERASAITLNSPVERTA